MLRVHQSWGSSARGSGSPATAGKGKHNHTNAVPMRRVVVTAARLVIRPTTVAPYRKTYISFYKPTRYSPTR